MAKRNFAWRTPTRLLGLALVASLAACNGGPTGTPRGADVAAPEGGAAPARVYLTLGSVEITAEVAADEATRTEGLMFRESLAPNSGMLFVFPDRARRAFWMLNVPIRLSLAYLDDDGTILEVVEMAPGAGIPPDQQRRYPSRDPVRYVLEMEGGWFGARGFGPGDRVDLSDAADIIPR